jgi:hypothetical protein
MMKLAVPEALVPIYQSACHCVPEDQNFREHHCCLPIVIWVIVSRMMRLMELVAHMREMRKAYSMLVKKYE